MALVLHAAVTSASGQRVVRVLARLAADARRILAVPARVLEHRRLMQAIAQMSDAQLRDIGLTAADLGDASAVPFGQDPSLLLEARRKERHAARVVRR